MNNATQTEAAGNGQAPAVDEMTQRRLPIADDRPPIVPALERVADGLFAIAEAIAHTGRPDPVEAMVSAPEPEPEPPTEAPPAPLADHVARRVRRTGGIVAKPTDEWRGGPPDELKNRAHSIALAVLVAVERAGSLAGERPPGRSSNDPEVGEIIRADHPGILESIRVGRQVPMLIPRVANFCHYGFAQQDRQAANEFFDRLDSGQGLPARHPILTLRNALLTEQAKRTTKIPAGRVIAMMRIAWKAYRKGQPLPAIKWDPTQPIPSLQD